MDFEECNKRLVSRDILFDINEYIIMSSNVISKSNYSNMSLSDVTRVIQFVNKISCNNPNLFVISLNDVTQIGFRIKDTFINKFKKMININAIDNAQNEYAFLKANNLKESVDYELVHYYANHSSEYASHEYKINTNAFYKLIANYYSKEFVTDVLSRSELIKHYYYKYLNDYYHNKMLSLHQTINGLCEDIQSIVNEYPQVKNHHTFSKGIKNVSLTKQKLRIYSLIKLEIRTLQTL